MIEYLSIRENWEFAVLLGFAWMAGVPLLLSVYYHWSLRRLSGAAALRRAQAQLAPTHGKASGSLTKLLEMRRRLNSGQIGPGARQLVRRMVIWSVVWAVICAIWFGVLLYVDARAPWRE